MYRYKLTLYLYFAIIGFDYGFVLSQKKLTSSLENVASLSSSNFPFTDRIDKPVNNLPYFFDEQMNGYRISAPAIIPASGKYRLAYQSNVDGYSRQEVELLNSLVSRYLPEWPHQTYQENLMNKHSLYQSASRQVYPTYSQIRNVHSFRYPTPSTFGYGSYSDYTDNSAYLRSNDERNYRHKVYVVTKIVIMPAFTSPTASISNDVQNKPITATNAARTIQSPMTSTVRSTSESRENKRFSADTSFKVIPESFGYPSLAELRKRTVAFDDIHRVNNQAMERIQQPSSLNSPQTFSLTAPQLALSTDEEIDAVKWYSNWMRNPSSLVNSNSSYRLRAADSTIAKSSEANTSTLENQMWAAVIKNMNDNKSVPKKNNASSENQDEKAKYQYEMKSGNNEELKQNDMVGAIFSASRDSNRHL